MMAALIYLVFLHAAVSEQETAAVDITGISRALVLSELFNNARCSRWRHFRKKMTADEAQNLIGKHVGEIYGVKMCIRVPKDDEESKLDVRAYNEANGDGHAEKVIENLKKKIGNGDVYGNNESCTEVRGPQFNSEDCELFCKVCAICVGATAGCAVAGAGCGACCGAIVGACTSPYVGAALGTCLGCGICAGTCCYEDVCTARIGMGVGAVYGAIIGATLGPATVAAAGAVVAGTGIGACIGAAAGSGTSMSVIIAKSYNNKEGSPQENSRMHETESPGTANPSQDTEPGVSTQGRVWKETRV